MNIAALKCKTLVRQFHHIVDAIGNEAGISYVVNGKTRRKILCSCKRHMLCKLLSIACIAGIFLRKNKEENPLLLQRQSHFPSENKED